VEDINQPLTVEERKQLNHRLPIQVNAVEDWAILVRDNNGNALDYANVRFSAEGHRAAEVWLGNFYWHAYSIP
jgi:hypothetical protein